MIPEFRIRVASASRQIALPVPDKAAAGLVHGNAAGFGLVAGIPPGRSYTITSMALKFTRWTDFLTSDGEKPERNRDSEFVEPPSGRNDLMKLWESGWSCLFSALEALCPADLNRTVTIRGEAHSVMQAINRQIAHYSYHCGQIVFLAKHFQHLHWKSPSTPRGQSAKFNQQVAAGDTSQR